jgi:membrane associated rhomboid family serine protease
MDIENPYKHHDHDDDQQKDDATTQKSHQEDELSSTGEFTKNKPTNTPQRDPWWREFWKTCFHRYQASPEWQYRPYLTYTLVPCITLITIVYAIVDETNIFVQILPPIFLRNHGGLALPSQAKEFPYKMFAAVFIHFDIWHLLTNMLLFMWLGAYLERKYHWWRWAAIMFMGIVGSTITYLSVYVWRTWNTAGSFPRGITQNKFAQHAPHVIFVGFSGVVYTGVGMYIMETFVNWSSIERKWFKVLATVFLTIEPILQTAFREELYQGVAVAAHIGGLIVGIGPAILYIPNDHSYIVDFLLTKVSILTYILLFVMMPIFVLASVYG